MTGRRGWLVPASLLIGFAAFQFPIENPDLWWHLSAGREIAGRWALPRFDFLSHTLPGTKWVDFEWGTQLVYYGLHSLGGFAALYAWRLLLLGVMVAAQLRLLALYGASPAARALGALLTCSAFIPISDLRPDNASLAFFSWLLLRLERRRLGEKLRPRDHAAAAAAFAVWANLHLGFLYGILLQGLYAAAAAAEALLPVAAGRRRGSLAPAREYAVFAAASAAGTLANPFLLELYGVLARHHAELGGLQDVIIEWSPPDFRPVFLGFWILLAASSVVLLAALARRSPPPLVHAAAFAYFAFAASRHQRHLAYFTLAAVPVLVHAAPSAFAGRVGGRFAAVLGSFVALTSALHVADVYSNVGFRPGWKIVKQPRRRAADFLRREQAALGGLRLFNTWGDGGYLGWRLYPEWRVFYDGRYIFHGLLFETKAALTDARRWRAHMARHGVQLAVMRQAGAKATLKLLPDEKGRKQPVPRPYWLDYMPPAEWALVYWNEEDLLFVRRDAVPAAWLARSEYKTLLPGDFARLHLEGKTGRLDEKRLREELARWDRDVQTPRPLPEPEFARDRLAKRNRG